MKQSSPSSPRRPCARSERTPSPLPYRKQSPPSRTFPTPSPVWNSPSERKDRRARHDQKIEKSLYLVMPDGDGASSGYAVHRIDVAHSRRGISISGEELTKPPVARFHAAPGMSFLPVGSKIVGVTGKDAAGADDKAESVIIDASSWEVSARPPPSSVKSGVVELAGKVYYVDMFTKDPNCDVLDPASAAAPSWCPLPRPPFSGRIVSLAVHADPPHHGLVVTTDDDGTYLFDDDGAAWVRLLGVPRPFEARSARAKGYGDMWLELPPADGRGRLFARELRVVAFPGEGSLVDDGTYPLQDPIPVTTPGERGGGATARRDTELVYMGRGKFCIVQAAAARRGVEAGRVVVTVTVFKVIDSERRAPSAESRRRRREGGMDMRWVASELEDAYVEKARDESTRGRRQFYRLNLWSRTYVVGGAAAGRPCLAAALWM